MSKKRKAWKLLPIVRVIAVLSAVGVITTVVTFAALQSSGNALQGNTIQTATAKLQISTDGKSFSDSVPGFNFTGIVPGGPAQPSNNGGYLVVLKNVGDTDLKLSLSVPTTPTVSGISDLSKVNLLVTVPNAPGGGTYPQQVIKLSSLIAGPVAITNQGTVYKNSTLTYHLQVSMDTDAVNGGSGSITGLDIAFSGATQ